MTPYQPVPRQARAGYTLVLAAAWVLGTFNALQHARDARVLAPTALVLPPIVVVLVTVATWIGYFGLRQGCLVGCCGGCGHCREFFV